MSTLLKKKYCRNNAIGDSAAVVQVIPCTMTEHDDSENSFDIDVTVARWNDGSKNNSVASAISTVTDEEDNAVDESPSTTAHLLSLSSPSSSLSLTASNDSTTNKSVRFDEETVITINASTIEEDSNVVQKYRNDIWYQVCHCTLVRAVHGFLVLSLSLFLTWLNHFRFVWYALLYFPFWVD
jgi:hypothetical protein